MILHYARATAIYFAVVIGGLFLVLIGDVNLLNQTREDFTQ